MAIVGWIVFFSGLLSLLLFATVRSGRNEVSFPSWLKAIVIILSCVFDFAASRLFFMRASVSLCLTALLCGTGVFAVTLHICLFRITLNDGGFTVRRFFVSKSYIAQDVSGIAEVGQKSCFVRIGKRRIFLTEIMRGFDIFKKRFIAPCMPIYSKNDP